MPDFVDGSSEAARELSEDLEKQVKTAKSEVDKIKEQLKALRSTFQDDGYDEMQRCVLQVTKALLESLEPTRKICDALNDYADALDDM